MSLHIVLSRDLRFRRSATDAIRQTLLERRGVAQFVNNCNADATPMVTSVMRW